MTDIKYYDAEGNEIDPPKPETVEKVVTDTNSEEFKAAVKAATDAALADIKAKLDGAYAARDEAVAKNAALEKAQADAKKEQLEREGKLVELAELKAAEANAALMELQKENTTLRRDQVVDHAIGSLEFRNERSRDMARREIIGNLEKDETGNWKSKDGLNIDEYVNAFSKNEDNAFLFKPKTNTGSGQTDNKGISNTNANKKPSEMTTQELLAAAAEGKFGRSPRDLSLS